MRWFFSVRVFMVLICVLFLCGTANSGSYKGFCKYIDVERLDQFRNEVDSNVDLMKPYLKTSFNVIENNDTVESSVAFSCSTIMSMYMYQCFLKVYLSEIIDLVNIGNSNTCLMQNKQYNEFIYVKLNFIIMSIKSYDDYRKNLTKAGDSKSINIANRVCGVMNDLELFLNKCVAACR